MGPLLELLVPEHEDFLAGPRYIVAHRPGRLRGILRETDAAGNERHDCGEEENPETHESLHGNLASFD